jgi:hypothetical protein
MNFNPWAVLVAAVVSLFGLGGLWYSRALFGAIWSREAGQLEAKEKTAHKHPAQVFGVSLVFSLLATAAFAYLLGPNPPLVTAIRLGLIVGICFVATSFGINYQFGNRSALMWLIDAGYHTLQFVLTGLILGLWH